jgi:hypothetical protein
MEKTLKILEQSIIECFEIFNHERDKHSNLEKFRQVWDKIHEQRKKDEEERDEKYVLTPEDESRLLQLIYKEIDNYHALQEGKDRVRFRSTWNKLRNMVWK